MEKYRNSGKEGTTKEKVEHILEEEEQKIQDNRKKENNLEQKQELQLK